MDLHVLKISREQFDCIPEEEQIFILQLCTILNDINMLQKFALFSRNKNFENSEFERKAQNAQTFFVLTMLAGKLFAGWEMVEKDFHSKGLRNKYFDVLPEDGKAALSYLGRYFSEQNLIYKIRNKFAFHYNSEEIKKELEANKDDSFELILSEYMGNCLFYFVNTIIGTAIVSEIDQNPQVAMNRTVEEILEVSKNLQTFLGYAMVVALEKYGINKDYLTFKLSDVPDLNTVHIPFFVKKNF